MENLVIFNQYKEVLPKYALIDWLIYCISQTWQHVAKFSVKYKTAYMIFFCSRPVFNIPRVIHMLHTLIVK